MNSDLSHRILVLGCIIILSACAGSEVPPTATPMPAEAVIEAEDQGADEEEVQPSTSADGEELYSNNCLRCHAADRSGNIGPSLLPSRLTEEASHYAEIISSGSGGMPSFGSKLSAEEINSLAEYILTDGE